MKHITFYLDFISPLAWLAFEQLPQALMGHSYSVMYQPILFPALLKHHGHDLPRPASHPFNSLALLQLAVACQAQGTPNRYVVETLFKHVWLGGAEAADPVRLQALTEQLNPPRSPDSDEVKAQLTAHTDKAIALGVVDVPTWRVDDQLFWGFDALPMLQAYLSCCRPSHSK